MFAAIDQIVISDSLAASRVCDLLEVSRSGFYSWRKEQRTNRELKDRELIPLVHDIFWLHRRRYGARRIAAELKRRDVLCGVARVARLLKTQGLVAIQPKSFKPRTTESRHRLGFNDNLLDSYPGPTRIDQVWVGDITYIPLRSSRFGYVDADGFAFPEDRRLVVPTDHERGTGDRLTDQSDRLAATTGRPDSPHRPRRPVRVDSLSCDPSSGINASKHVGCGQLLRQRVHGIVFWNAKDGTSIGGLRRRCRSHQRARLVRQLLQRRAASFIAGLPVALRIRTSIHQQSNRSEIRDWRARATRSTSTFQRSYRDEVGELQSTANYRMDDMAAVSFLSAKAYDFLVSYEEQ